MQKNLLYFVGLGLGPKGITVEGIEAIKDSTRAYIEYYTSPHDPQLLRTLTELTSKELIVVDRLFVENGEQILREAEEGTVSLLVPGDPMIATTHNDLRVRALKRGIRVKIVHSSTIVSAAPSISGLHYYKFGATITATKESVNSVEQIYNLLHKNLLLGRHTMILLAFDSENGDSVLPSDVFKALIRCENNYKRNVISEDTFAIVLSRIAMKNQTLFAGKIKNMVSKDYGEHPHTIIIPGSLHFTEREAISAIFSLKDEDITDNSSRIERVAQVLLPRYLEKFKKVITQIEDKLEDKYRPVIENSILYSKDAESFLARGEDELAMLSMGYAEGLIDSLNYLGEVEIKW